MHELDAQLQQPQSEGNLLRGIAFAFLFSIGGMVAWILFGGLLDIISAWAALLIGYLAALGYYYGKGPKNMKIRIPVLMLVYVAAVMISLIASYAIHIERNRELLEFGVEHGNLASTGIFYIMSYDLAIILVFSLIGLAYVPFSHLSMPDHIQKMREQRMDGQPENPWGETQGQDPIGFTDSTQLENPTTEDSPQNPENPV